MRTVTSPKTITAKDGREIIVVNDIHEAADALSRQITIARFEWGDSMSPLLLNGEYAIVEPYDSDVHTIKSGDAVLCEVNGYLMTHMVLVASNVADKPYYLISDSMGGIYGWTDKILGIAHGTRIFEKHNSEESSII